MNERKVLNGARWRHIAEALTDEISAGRFGVGRLPTEPELAERFSVNRHTVRRAVGSLVEQGLLTVAQGRGTFVANSQIDYVLGRRTRFSANLRREGRRSQHRMLGCERLEADIATAADLAIQAGAPIIRLETLGLTDGIGLSYSMHVFPAERFEALPEAYRQSGSITAALAACGVTDYTRHVSRILARTPTDEEARHLDQPLSRPVLQVEAVNVDPAGVPVERATSVFAGDRVQIVVKGDETDS